MPKLVRNRYYDLNTRFRDSSGNYYRSASALVLWTRMSVDAPTDAGPLGLSPTYDGSPTITEPQIGSEIYSAAAFSDADDANAQVTDTEGRLCFSSLADGGTPTTSSDRPFSISCWVKVTGFGGNSYFFGKQGFGGGSKGEYRAWYDGDGDINFKLEDTDNSDADEYIYNSSASDRMVVGDWTHIVFTYDGRGGTSANTGMSIYKDGAVIAVTLAGSLSYKGMQPEYDNPLYIGASQSGNQEVDAQMAEFAIWDKVLSAEEILAIYNVTQDSLKVSGYLNNPPRTILQERDDHPGSYPTVARSGDPDFTGRGTISFDDTKTVEFFSSYAAGEIVVTKVPRDADAIMLTGSVFHPVPYNLNSNVGWNDYGSATSLQGWWRLNEDVSSSGDVTDSSGNSRDGEFDAAGDRPAYSTTLYPASYIQKSSNTFDGSADAINIGTAATWDAIIGNNTGGGSTQQMSFSAWVYKTGDGGNNFGRIIQFGEQDAGVIVFTSSSEALYMTTYWNSGVVVHWNVAGPAFSLNAWHHVVITYDANSTSNDAVIYINGVSQTVVESGTAPAGTWDGIATDACYVGNQADGTRTWEGNLADVAVWNTILTAGQVSEIYNAATSLKRLFEFQRGVLQYYKVGGPGNEDSILVNITGKQTPSTVATKLAQAVEAQSMGIKAIGVGNKVTLTQHIPMFVDTLILSQSRYARWPIPIQVTQFSQHGPSEYLYPFVLPVGSSHISGRVATPNTTGSLTAAASMRPGVSDVGIKFTPGEQLTPFNETRIPMDNDSAFFTTGTLPTVLPGFSQRLSSKVAFSVDLTPTERTDVYFSTGTLPGASEASSAAGITAGINSGLAYFNFSANRWELIGDLTTGSNVDYLNAADSLVTGSYLAVLPGKAAATSFGTVLGAESSANKMRSTFKRDGGWVPGMPCDYAGFPVATKFDATGSQLLDMSQYIHSPFLCEKISLEISGAFGTPPTVDPGLTENYAGRSYTLMDPGPYPITFMLLNQFETELANDVTFRTTRTAVDFYPIGAGFISGEPDLLRITESNYPSSRNKEIVWHGRVASFEAGNSADSTFSTPGGWTDEGVLRKAAPGFYSAADVWLPVALNVGGGYGIDTTTAVYTGSVTINAAARTVPIAPLASPFSPTRSGSASGLKPEYAAYVGNSPMFGIENGGRNLFSLASGRSIVHSVVGSKIVDEYYNGIEYPTVADRYMVPVYDGAQSLDSPYVLMPTDKLVLAVANQRYPMVGSSSAGGSGFYQGRGYNMEGCSQLASASSPGRREGVDQNFLGADLWSMTFTPYSKAKITFYGSMIREGKPVSPGLNQPLTSDAIHEDVRDDISPYGEALCLDQFDVDPETSYRGSYLDNIVTGSMYGSQFVNPEAANVRKVISSVVDGQAGITGSLQRFVRLANEAEKFYDSYPPDVLSVLDAAGAGLYSAAATGPAMIIVGSGPTADATPPVDLSWYARYAYELIQDRRLQQTLKDTRAPAYSLDASSEWGEMYVDSGYDRTVVIRTRIYDVYLTNNGTSYTHRILVSDRDGSTATAASGRNTMKALWGFGDGLIGTQWGRWLGLNNMPSFAIISNESGYTYNVPEIRGYKYGLINYQPSSPSAVFRYDTYGQFRDMLEPRLHTRYFADGELGESAVQVVFIGRDGDVGVKPNTTNSQNLSTFATSSVPYFDGLIRERATIEPDLVPDGHIVLELL